MSAVRNLIDIAWSYSPDRVAAITPWLLGKRYHAILSYRSSFVRPGRRFPCWWSPSRMPGNLGDMLTPILISRLFGLVPIYCPRQSFIGVGSVIHKARSGTVVWGSGLIAQDAKDNPDAHYLAVRGPLTRKILLKRGRTVPEIYGDPAILMPLVHQPDVTIEHELGLLPHSWHLPRVKRLPSDISLINVRAGSVDEVYDRIDQIARHAVIASSSLHGLILALVYGRKIVWLRDSTHKLTGDMFKFEDFFASIGVKATPIDWSPEDPAPFDLTRHAISAKIPDHLSHDLLTAFEAYANALDRD